MNCTLRAEAVFDLAALSLLQLKAPTPPLVLLSCLQAQTQTSCCLQIFPLQNSLLKIPNCLSLEEGILFTTFHMNLNYTIDKSLLLRTM